MNLPKKIIRALLLYFSGLISLALVPIIMITSAYAFGRSKDLLSTLIRETKQLSKDAIFYHIVKLKKENFRSISYIMKRLYRYDHDYYDLLAEKSYVEKGIPASLPFLIRGEELRSANISEAIQGNVQFFDPGWASVFGHIANLSLFPKLELLGWVNPRHKIIYYRQTANPSFLAHYDDMYAVCKFSEKIAGSVENVFRGLSQSMNIIDTGRYGALDLYSAQNLIEESFAKQFGNERHLLSLRPDIEKSARILLDQIGFNHEDWFVTLHMRETHEQSKLRGADNVNPRDYIAAIKLILDFGGSVLRLGNPTMTPLDKLGLKHPRLLDYAHSGYQHPDIDMFALSKCAFLLGTQSGPASVPNEFGRPIVYTNVVAFARSNRFRGFCIPKLIRDKRSGNFLTLAEGIKNPLAWNIRLNFEQFERVDNTSTDILEATQIALETLKRNNWNANSLDFRQGDEMDLATRGGVEIHTPILRSFCERYELLK